MRHRRLLWHLYPSYLMIILISLTAVTWYASNSFRNFLLEQTAEDLESRARLIEKQFPTLMGAMNSKGVDSLCKALGKISSTRLTAIHISGKVLGDSEENPNNMDNHADRPEFIKAISSGEGMSIRYSYTLEKDMMYVAIPIRDSSEVLGVLRVSIPITSLDRVLNSASLNIALAGLIVILAAAVMSFYISRRISRPLEEIKRGAERFAAGELQHKLPYYNSLEINGLAAAMNEMAMQLDNRIRTIISQSNEQQAVLESMVEGVLAIDTEENILGFNEAASRLLGLKLDAAKGRILHETIRNIDLQRFTGKILSANQPAEEEIILRENGERYLQIHGTVLRDADGKRIGAVVVFNDVTRLHRLEDVRKDFVANVSHELKTPVTSIKGFVETLLDGAISDESNARRFLEVIAKQADRLNLIIDDLLTLSRIEQDAARAEISFKIQNLKPVLKTAIEVCQLKAHEHKIETELHCDDQLSANINAPLLEQAVINLLDNAIKFSEADKKIEIEVTDNGKEIIISVKDHGCGITRKHLPRLFERFYMVDKVRSRKLGGTGLGLAIVKHIAQLHDGYPTVESDLGKGSIFALHLPKPGFEGNSGSGKNQLSHER